MSEKRKKGYTLDGVPYRVYIHSPEWEAVKQRYRSSRLPQHCLICKNPNFDLHHRTYKNLGRERLMDLIPLCRDHHKKTHKIEKAHGELWAAHKRLKRKGRKMKRS